MSNKYFAELNYIDVWAEKLQGRFCFTPIADRSIAIHYPTVKI